MTATRERSLQSGGRAIRLPRRRVGLMGGTFDPPHHGHLRMAGAAERACELERVYFAPAAHPWHKPAPAASYEDRHAMLALALDGRRRWIPLHIPGAGPATYLADQLGWLGRHRPQERIYFIVGADAFVTLPSWKRYPELLGMCDYVVVAREGVGFEAVLSVLPGPDRPTPIKVGGGCMVRLGGGRGLHWLANFTSPASSTGAREWLAASEPLGRSREAPRGYAPVPAAVARYARRAGLYRYGNKH